MVSIFESIADRHIKAGQQAGLFDNLAGAGKPIADLGTERPPGWFAARLARRERSKINAEDLEVEIRLALAAAMRSDTEAAVRLRVAEINTSISEYNRTTHWNPRNLVDADFVAGEWLRLRREL